MKILQKNEKSHILVITRGSKIARFVINHKAWSQRMLDTESRNQFEDPSHSLHSKYMTAVLHHIKKYISQLISIDDLSLIHI